MIDDLLEWIGLDDIDSTGWLVILGIYCFVLLAIWKFTFVEHEILTWKYKTILSVAMLPIIIILKKSMPGFKIGNW